MIESADDYAKDSRSALRQRLRGARRVDHGQGGYRPGERHHGPHCHQGVPGAGAKKVFDRERVVLVPDHFAPNKDIPSAIQCQIFREFARTEALIHFSRAGTWGWSMPCCRRRAGGAGRPGHRRGQPHLHLRGPGAFATGVGSTDLAAAMVTGECLVQGAGDHQFPTPAPFALGHRQGPDPPHHRRHRR